VNALAAAAGEALLREPRRARRWQQRAGRWVAQEGAWLQQALAATPGIEPMPSATNFLLVRGCRSPGTPQALAPVGEALQRRHGILLRDCRSFAGLDGSWLRIGLQHRAANLRIVAALRQELSAAVAAGPPDR
jgi:histidinol-phosphate/aromatic aminotransferase/cobyric acid decarboxylase-like protein